MLSTRQSIHIGMSECNAEELIPFEYRFVFHLKDDRIFNVDLFGRHDNFFTLIQSLFEEIFFFFFQNGSFIVID